MVLSGKVRFNGSGPVKSEVCDNMREDIRRETIRVGFSEEEAIVLLEWLSHFNEQKHESLFQDQAEERVLFDLEAKLEKLVTATFEESYKEILSEARQRIRDE